MITSIVTYLIIYVVVLFSGDESMFLLGYISSQGYLNIFIIFIVSILANLTSDIFFFLMGEKIINKIKSKHIKKYKNRTNKLFKKVRYPELVLVLSKFVYGTRVLTVITLGMNKNISIKRFIAVSIFCLSFIAIIVMSLGYFFGTIINSHIIYRNFTLLFSIAILFIILIIFRKWIMEKSVQLFLPTEKKKE